MISDFIIDNQLYLDFLQIKKEEIPTLNNIIHKQDFYKLVEKQFRLLARKYHPDFGGNNEEFKFLLKCKSKLIEENNENKSFNFKINDDKHQCFDNKSLAGEVGNQLFELISSWSNEIQIKPVFKPTTSEHEYEWIFNILDTNIQLSLNIQNLNNDLAELSHKLYNDDSLSVLICLFIPSKKLTPIKSEYDNSIQLIFNDQILLESSKASDVKNYFNTPNNLKNDLEKIKNNNFKSKKGTELKLKKPEETIEKDKKIFDYIQSLKLFNTTYNENAADFIDKL